MKYNPLLCFLSALLFINVSSAAFIRVINAVPDSQGLDIWVRTQTQTTQSQSQSQNQSQSSNQTQLTPEPAIRLFQNVTYGDIPPYFFITDKSTPWTFLFSNATNATALTSDQVQTLQSFAAPLQPNNNYTLVVASNGQGSTYQFLLLTDRLTQQPQGDTTYVRLLNVGAPGQVVTLISGGSCPSNSSTGRAQMRTGTIAGVVTQAGRPFQSQSGTATYAGGIAGTVQSGSQSQSATEGATEAAPPAQSQTESSQPTQSTQPPVQPPIASNIIAIAPYLRAGSYVPLPQSADKENLQICVGGQAYPVHLAASYRGDSNMYSVVVFQSNAASQDAVLKRQRLMNEEAGISGDSQGQSGNQQGQQGQSQGYLGFITDDVPLAVNNSRIRVIHADSQSPSMDIYVDSQLLFTAASYASVSMYQRTYRGLHNITIVPSSQSQGSQTQNSSIQFPYTFFTFLAWDSFYTLAILPTGVFMMQGQSGQSMDNLQPTRESGFMGPFHRIFLDKFAPETTIQSGSAYIQAVHLAPIAGAVTVNISGNARLLLPFENSFYVPIQANTRPIAITLLSSSQGQQGSGSQQGQGSQGGSPTLVSQQFQPNTLYTLFILDSPNNQVNAFIVRDRAVAVTCRVTNM